MGIFRIALAGALIALFLGAAAYAQPTPPAQPQAPGSAPPVDASAQAATPEEIDVVQNCSAPFPSGDLNSAQRKAAAECLEIQRLQAELDARKNGPASLLPFKMSPEEATLLAGLLALLAAGLGYLVKHINEWLVFMANSRRGRRERIEQRIDGWRTDLTGLNRPAQRLAIVGLVRIAKNKGAKSRLSKNGTTDAHMIITGLLAWLTEKHPEDAPVKYAADELRKLFKSRPGTEEFKKARWSGRRFLLKDFNLQRLHVINGWWAQIDGQGADFYGADLTKTSFRLANLSSAVFFNAVLKETVFAGADLTKANLQGADLSGANFKGADLTGAINLRLATFSATTVWDEKTKWPEGFTPPHPAD